MQTLHWKTPVCSGSYQEPSCCEKTVLTTEPPCRPFCEQFISIEPLQECCFCNIKIKPSCNLSNELLNILSALCVSRDVTFTACPLTFFLVFPVLLCAQVTIWSMRMFRGLMNRQRAWIMAGAPVSLRVMTSNQTPRSSHRHAARWEQAQVQLMPKSRSYGLQILTSELKAGCNTGDFSCWTSFFF